MVKKVLLLCFLLICFLFISTNVYAADIGLHEPGIVETTPVITNTIWDSLSDLSAKIEIIIGLVVGFLTLSTYTVTLYAKYTTSKKRKAEAEALAAKLDTYKKVASSINKLVEEAEKFIGYSGAEKKQYVTTRINQFCIDNNIEYDITLVSSLIESAVNLTKTVNARGTVSKKLEVPNEAL